MTRQTQHSNLLNAKNLNEKDDYQSKIVKLIPGDIVGVYLGVCTIIQTSLSPSHSKNIMLWIVFVVIFLITPFYLKRIGKVIQNRQVLLITLAFFIWAISLPGPFQSLKNIIGIDPQLIGSIILPIFTLIAPMIYSENTSES